MRIESFMRQLLSFSLYSSMVSTNNRFDVLRNANCGTKCLWLCAIAYITVTILSNGEQSAIGQSQRVMLNLLVVAAFVTTTWLSTARFWAGYQDIKVRLLYCCSNSRDFFFISWRFYAFITSVINNLQDRQLDELPLCGGNFTIGLWEWINSLAVIGYLLLQYSSLGPSLRIAIIGPSPWRMKNRNNSTTYFETFAAISL